MSKARTPTSSKKSISTSSNRLELTTNLNRPTKNRKLTWVDQPIQPLLVEKFLETGKKLGLEEFVRSQIGAQNYPVERKKVISLLEKWEEAEEEKKRRKSNMQKLKEAANKFKNKITTNIKNKFRRGGGRKTKRKHRKKRRKGGRRTKRRRRRKKQKKSHKKK